MKAKETGYNELMEAWIYQKTKEVVIIHTAGGGGNQKDFSINP